MEDQLYVRIRGRVQGPFDTEKLRALVRRGQLSRMHEVSNDGNDWKQASEYSELFATATKQTHEEPEASSFELIFYYISTVLCCIQYVINPFGDSDTDNATILGLQLSLNF